MRVPVKAGRVQAAIRRGCSRDFPDRMSAEPPLRISQGAAVSHVKGAVDRIRRRLRGHRRRAARADERSDWCRPVSVQWRPFGCRGFSCETYENILYREQPSMTARLRPGSRAKGLCRRRREASPQGSLGPYEIISRGAGGMARLQTATRERSHRRIKILTEALAADPHSRGFEVRRGRFPANHRTLHAT